jgi:hypothetical protein
MGWSKKYPNKHMSNREIAEIVGCPASTVYHRCDALPFDSTDEEIIAHLKSHNGKKKKYKTGIIRRTSSNYDIARVLCRYADRLDIDPNIQDPKNIKRIMAEDPRLKPCVEHQKNYGRRPTLKTMCKMWD